LAGARVKSIPESGVMDNKTAHCIKASRQRITCIFFCFCRVLLVHFVEQPHAGELNQLRCVHLHHPPLYDRAARSEALRVRLAFLITKLRARPPPQQASHKRAGNQTRASKTGVRGDAQVKKQPSQKLSNIATVHKKQNLKNFYSTYSKFIFP
jgi:hypothetical protein